MAKGDRIGEFEHLVLMIIISLREEAYGMKVRRRIDETTGRDVSIGSVYAALDRLEAKGFVRSWEGDPTPERGGRAKRFFEMTGSGQRALLEFDAAYMQLRRSLVRSPVLGNA